MTMKDLTGQRFGRLVALELIKKNSKTYWKCTCDCGNNVMVYRYSLIKGNTKSCGCLRSKITAERHRTHGQAGGDRTSVYRSWMSMRRRCLNPKRDNYKHYGGRGISICDGWKENFEAFFKSMGNPPIGRTLDRIRNSLGYNCGECAQCKLLGHEKNCRWATQKDQMRNTRKTRYLTIGDQTLSLVEWAERMNVPYYLIENRLRYGWSEKDAILLPAKSGVPHRKRTLK